VSLSALECRPDEGPAEPAEAARRYGSEPLRCRRSRRGAFTLVELLVVIGVIGLLISILLPALSSAQAQSRKVKCMSNLRSLGQAISLYGAENKGSLPWGVVPSRFGTEAEANADADYYDWMGLLDFNMSKGARAMGAISGSTPFVRPTAKRQPVISNVFLCPDIDTATYNMASSYAVHPVAIPNWFAEVYGPQVFTGTGTGTSDGPGRGFGSQVAPAKLTQLYNDTPIMWDTHGVVPTADRVQGVTKFAAYSCIDGQNLEQPRDRDLRYRSRARDMMDSNPYKGARHHIFVPKPADPNDQADWQYNRDVGPGNPADNSQLGNLRFRHARERECNLLMGDFSVQTLRFDVKKKHPLAALADQSYFVDLRRNQLRIKRPSYLGGQ
jgi:prepilin-type N-terminal cleavage/methylation domain-containing protein